jgi:hypothetical protein
MAAMPGCMVARLLRNSTGATRLDRASPSDPTFLPAPVTNP